MNEKEEVQVTLDGEVIGHAELEYKDGEPVADMDIQLDVTPKLSTKPIQIVLDKEKNDGTS